MTNMFMLKSENVFKKTASIIKNIKLKKNVDFIIVDVHGEFAGEKIALGHMLDGKSTLYLVHTHMFLQLIIQFCQKEPPIKLI